jgi:hypothetical protein
MGGSSGTWHGANIYQMFSSSMIQPTLLLSVTQSIGTLPGMINMPCLWGRDHGDLMILCQVFCRATHRTLLRISRLAHLYYFA